jgi:hypothetical protein
MARNSIRKELASWVLSQPKGRRFNYLMASKEAGLPLEPVRRHIESFVGKCLKAQRANINNYDYFVKL